MAHVTGLTLPEPVGRGSGEEFVERDSAATDQPGLCLREALREGGQTGQFARPAALDLDGPDAPTVGHDEVDLLRAVAPVGHGEFGGWQAREQVRAPTAFSTSRPQKLPSATVSRRERSDSALMMVTQWLSKYAQ